MTDTECEHNWIMDKTFVERREVSGVLTAYAFLHCTKCSKCIKKEYKEEKK